MGTKEVVVVVLAAGAGSRFRMAPGSAASSMAADRSAVKLLALLRGRPVLQHVLDHVALLAPAATIVVLGHDAEAIERQIEWREELLIRNAAPQRGISSSVSLGLEAVAGSAPAAKAALVVLGDQPHVRPDIVRRLISSATDTGTQAFVVPSYSEGTGGNPVLVRRDAWPLAATLSGDRGFASLLAERPELVATVAIEGANPDVDTPADLAALEQSQRARGRPGEA